MNKPPQNITPRSIPKKPEGFLERMQGRSKAEKNSIAFFSAVGVTSVIGLLWIVSVVINFNAQTGAKVVTVKDESTSVFSSTFGALKDQMAGALASMPGRETEPAADTSMQELVDSVTAEPRAAQPLQAQTEVEPESPREPRMVLIATSSTATSSSQTTSAVE